MNILDKNRAPSAITKQKKNIS